MAYRVTAPFVMLKVKDAVTGVFTFQGLYEGAIVGEVDPDNLKHHLDLGMVEEVDAPAAPAVAEESESAGRSSHPAGKSRHT